MASIKRFFEAVTVNYVDVGGVFTATGQVAVIPSTQTVRLTGYAANYRLNHGANAQLIALELYINSVSPSNQFVDDEAYKASGNILDFLLLPNDIVVVNFYGGNANEQAIVSIYGEYL